jgi:Flp pilus assembly protein TadD
LIEKEIAHHPDNEELLMTAAQAYMTQGLFTNALHVIKLKLLLTPGDPTWLYSEGYTYMRLNDYEEAIAPLTQVLNLQTNNTDAQLNRAIAYLNTGKLDAARDDYKKLRQTTPNSFQVAYGLGEIAWREHDTNAVISNYTVYLANAPTNTAEAKMISQRLTEAKGKLP